MQLVDWQKNKIGELIFCEELKVHNNDKVIDKDYPHQTWTQGYSRIIMSPIYLAKLTSRNLNIKFKLTWSKMRDINKTSRGLFKACRLTQVLKNLFSVFKNCVKLTLKGIKDVGIIQDFVLVYGLSKGNSKKMLRHEGWRREKFSLLLMRKQLTRSKQIMLLF